MDLFHSKVLCADMALTGGTSVPFKETILHEDGFRVVLSNEGKKPHANPNPINYMKAPVRCAHPSCTRVTKSMYGVCSSHKNTLIHTADWVGILEPDPGTLGNPVGRAARPAGPIVNAFAPAHSATTEYLVRWMEMDSARQSVMDRFIESSLESVVGRIPDATTLQSNLASGTGFQPDDVVGVLRDVVSLVLPYAQYSVETLEDVRLKIENDKYVVDIPLRIGAALLAVGFACEESNRSDLWFRILHNVDPLQSRRASAYMSVAYYLLRRHTKATPKQARISLRA